MCNSMRSVMVMIVAGMLISAAVYAAPEAGSGPVAQEKTTVVDVGNKICPVMGEEVNGKDYYEYKGKRYGLCCKMCPGVFAGDPEKYSAIALKEAAGNK